MIAPALPADEAQRLRTLFAYGLLDTPPEPQFDRVTRLAAHMFEAPIALVSLVDRDRQWFKARCGLNAPETGRDVSFCGHAILSDDVFVVRQANKDERFADNPLVAGPPNIRTYMGAPLIAQDGARLGTLCVIFTVVTPIMRHHEEQIALLSEIVVDHMEARRRLTPAAP